MNTSDITAFEKPRGKHRGMRFLLPQDQAGLLPKDMLEIVSRITERTSDG